MLLEARGAEMFSCRMNLMEVWSYGAIWESCVSYSYALQPVKLGRSACGLCACVSAREMRGFITMIGYAQDDHARHRSAPNEAAPTLSRPCATRHVLKKLI